MFVFLWFEATTGSSNPDNMLHVVVQKKAALNSRTSATARDHGTDNLGSTQITCRAFDPVAANQYRCITMRKIFLPSTLLFSKIFTRLLFLFSFFLKGLSPRCLPSGMILTCLAGPHRFGILSRSQRSMSYLRGNSSRR